MCKGKVFIKYQLTDLSTFQYTAKNL